VVLARAAAHLQKAKACAPEAARAKPKRRSREHSSTRSSTVRCPGSSAPPSASPDKEADALKLGADRLLASSDAAAMTRAASSIDLIIDTVPTKHDLSPYVPLLDIDGTLVIVGQLGPIPELHSVPLIAARRSIAGSPAGGLQETQELLDFCARKDIHPECELVRMEQINEAFDRLDRSDVRYRFVIDMGRFEAGK
jgi:uncharacterized zinc-type alcohol dehydrogenase-like protein